MLSSDLFSALRRTASHYVRHRGRSWTESYLETQRARGRWAFIHINKCGGTSVEDALNIPKIHDTARQRRDRLGLQRWDALVSFSIVRHPYSRVRSLYQYRIKTAQTGLQDRHIGLNDWIAEVFVRQNPVYHNNTLMFLPARAWLTDEDDRIIVDFVGRLEDIDRDWARIQELIGIRATLPRKNTTAPEKGLKDGLSAVSLATLDRYFAVDFDTFGYER